MRAILTRSSSIFFVIASFTGQVALGQVPRPLNKVLVLESREFPIPFTGYNYADRNCIAFSTDGTLLATGAESNIVVWDVETRKIIARMQLPEKQRSLNLAFTDDGKKLVSYGGNDQIIRFWDVKTGKQKGERPHANAPKESLPPRPGKTTEKPDFFLAFAPGGHTMAFTDKINQNVEFVDTFSGKVKLKLDRATAGWWGDWAFSRDGKLFVTSGWHQLILHVWNAQTGELINTMGDRERKSHGGYTSLRFSSDSKYVLAYERGSGFNDRYLSIWGVEDGLEYCRLPMWVYPGEMSPDGRMLILASGGHFALFDLLADKKIDNIKLPASALYHAQCSPDGLTLALLGGSGEVKGKSAICLAPFPTLGDDTPPKGRLTAADQDDLWKGLSSSNLFRRRYVTKIFKAHAQQAVALVEGKVKPVPTLARQGVVDLIKELDDNDFERRDSAMKKLQAEAFRFEPFLRETVKKSPAGELRNRVMFVLNEITEQPIPANLLSDLRGIELLESLATPAARKVLESLGNGASGARITLEAGLALKRMGK